MMSIDRQSSRDSENSVFQGGHISVLLNGFGSFVKVTIKDTGLFHEMHPLVVPATLRR
jgi:hypothetical protein